MKKIFAILAVLMVVPFVSMAATMSDADLSAVTGQSGITIDVSAMDISLGLGTLTWGDLDGFKIPNSFDPTGTEFTQAGFINIAFFPVPMHVGLTELLLNIDIGESVSSPSLVAINLSGSLAGLTIDAIVADIYLDSTNGATVDYVANGTTNPFPGVFGFVPAYYGAGAGILNQNLGEFGISNISVAIPSFNIAISAH